MSTRSSGAAVRVGSTVGSIHEPSIDRRIAAAADPGGVRADPVRLRTGHGRVRGDGHPSSRRRFAAVRRQRRGPGGCPGHRRQRLERGRPNPAACPRPSGDRTDLQYGECRRRAGAQPGDSPCHGTRPSLGAAAGPGQPGRGRDGRHAAGHSRLLPRGRSVGRDRLGIRGRARATGTPRRRGWALAGSRVGDHLRVLDPVGGKNAAHQDAAAAAPNASEPAARR